MFIKEVITLSTVCTYIMYSRRIWPQFIRLWYSCINDNEIVKHCNICVVILHHSLRWAMRWWYWLFVSASLMNFFNWISFRPVLSSSVTKKRSFWIFSTKDVCHIWWNPSWPMSLRKTRWNEVRFEVCKLLPGKILLEEK